MAVQAEPLAAWKAAQLPETQAWLDRHPDALRVFGSFGEQGFEDCAALGALMLPPLCLSRECDC